VGVQVLKYVILAVLVTFSRLALADMIDPKCVERLESQPLCLSKLNSQLYCARMWFSADAAQMVAECFDRLKAQNLSLSRLQSICAGPLAISDTDDFNKSLCDDN